MPLFVYAICVIHHGCTVCCFCIHFLLSIGMHDCQLILTVKAAVPNDINVRNSSSSPSFTVTASPLQMVILTPISSMLCASTHWICWSIFFLFSRFAISPCLACLYWIHVATFCWMATEEPCNCPWQSERELLRVVENSFVLAMSIKWSAQYGLDRSASGAVRIKWLVGNGLSPYYFLCDRTHFHTGKGSAFDGWVIFCGSITKKIFCFRLLHNSFRIIFLDSSIVKTYCIFWVFSCAQGIWLLGWQCLSSVSPPLRSKLKCNFITFKYK